MKSLFVFAVAFGILCGGASHSQAGTIQFQSTDLADAVLGEDLWEYRYSLNGFSFGADQGFSIYFDSTLYGAIESPPPFVNPDWNIITIQPDSSLPSDGLYDAVSLVNGASLSDSFVVTFVWLGGAVAPGAQPFTINEFDSTGNISFLDNGHTAPFGLVPEPASTMLISIGAAGAVVRRRRTRTNHISS